MKYKILGFTLTFFILFMIMLRFLPKGKIDLSKFSLENTDSIRVRSDFHTTMIYDSSTKKELSDQLMNMQRIDVDRRINESHGDTIIIMQFSKNENTPTIVKLFSNDYYGKVIEIDNHYFKSHSLHSVILKIINSSGLRQ
jgi:hypothetical protein